VCGGRDGLCGGIPMYNKIAFSSEHGSTSQKILSLIKYQFIVVHRLYRPLNEVGILKSSLCSGNSY
jgi:hypothetical protein